MGFRHSISIVAAILTVFSAVYGFAQDAPVDFARDIRPLLADNCFTCHGPDARARKGGFRLDQQESAFGVAQSGEHPIVPGKLDDSELVWRITSDDPDDRMPPPESEKQLTGQQRELLKRWVTEGARWRVHWAFVAPRQTEKPNITNGEWIRNPIDRFVLAKLESLGRHPAPTASRTTLIRRLFLDIIGLPPTPEQIDQFLADSSPNAYDNLVDALLASPHYGEHIASHWLDAARFADTNGYQNDFRRSMWPWRDWVIRAFNENMPFDQFTIEQIAGDMLENPSLNQRIATGFNRNHRTVTEGGSIESEWLVENVVDRVETTSTVFLGLTMGCARCHDHKYDPVTQREFYQFFAYFNNVNEKGVYLERRGNVPPVIQVVTTRHKQRLAEFDESITRKENEVESLTQIQTQQQAKWESTISSRDFSDEPVDYRVGLVNRDTAPRPTAISVKFDAISGDKKLHTIFGPSFNIQKKPNNHIDLGSAFDFDGSGSFTVASWIKPQVNGAIVSCMDGSNDYRGFDLLIMPDGRINVHLIHKWPENAIKVTTQSRVEKDKWTHVTATYDGTGKASGVRVFLNAQPVELETNSDSLQGTTITDHPFWIGMRADTTPYIGLISDIRIYDRKLGIKAIGDVFLHSVQHLIKSNDRSDEQQLVIDHVFQTRSAELNAAKKQLEQLRSEQDKYKSGLPTTMVMEELSKPRDTYVLQRGQYDQPDKSQKVTPGIPEILSKTKNNYPANRLGLARWLVDPSNPLTARVTVNRFWARFYGVGILDTPENFGVQSPPPSHPELLDWLALEFIRSGWDVKHIQKLIVTSATYRQTSVASEKQYRSDPNNRLLARGPRFRLPAEAIRDNALAISGLLNPQVGGPSIKPYQPEGLWKELAGGAGEPPYKQDVDNNLYRRSLYIYRKRTVPHPTMSTFDAASREICQVARSRTNTPLQALALLNDVTYVEAARQLAVLALDLEIDNRLSYMFRRSTGRFPSQREQQVLERSLEKYRARFAESPENAKKFVSVGNTKVDFDRHDAVELAAFAAVAGVILNLDETITRE